MDRDKKKILVSILAFLTAFSMCFDALGLITVCANSEANSLEQSENTVLSVNDSAASLDEISTSDNQEKSEDQENPEEGNLVVAQEKPINGPLYEQLEGEEEPCWHYYKNSEQVQGTEWILDEDGNRLYYLENGVIKSGLFSTTIVVEIPKTRLVKKTFKVKWKQVKKKVKWKKVKVNKRWKWKYRTVLTWKYKKQTKKVEETYYETQTQTHKFCFSSGDELTPPTMQTGYQNLDGTAYYFQPDTDNTFYGATFSGPILENSKLVYYNNDTKGLATGWVAYDYKAYYFYKGNEGNSCDYGCLAKNYTLYDYKDSYKNEMTFNEDGCIAGDRGKALYYGINVLNKNGWSLKSAYTYCYKLKYANRPYRPSKVAIGAIYGFTKGSGNCYVMNCCFHTMADLMGYQTRQIKGSVGKYKNPHSWLEIYQDGKWWVYDANFRNETGKNGFKIYYGKSGTWKYNRTSNYLSKY